MGAVIADRNDTNGSRHTRGPIIVSRHGRPALDRSAGPKLTWQEYVDWWERYEAGSLAADQKPPEKLKAVVKDAAEAIRPEHPIQASVLEKASTHWFRHTSVTHGDDAGIDLKYLTRSARHEKIETTAIYQHAEDDMWHKAWQKLKF